MKLTDGGLLPAPLKPVTQPLPTPEPPAPSPSRPARGTGVGDTRVQMVVSRHVSSPSRSEEFCRCQVSFLDSNYAPPPLPFLLSPPHRTVHASGGAAAQRAGLVLCAGELAPSAGAQRHHRPLQAPVQRERQPAGALVGEALPGRWAMRQRPTIDAFRFE